MSRKRIRAHANPLSDVDVDWPLSPDAVPWNEHYPAYLTAGNVPTALAAAAAASPSDSASSTAAAASSASSGPARRSPLAEVRVADIGCGFGGMSVALAEIFPDKLVLGLEIRDPVVDIVKERIEKLRKAALAKAPAVIGGFQQTNSAAPSPAPWMVHAPSYAASAADPTVAAVPFTYQNVACVKTNFMKYAPNFFRQGQLDALFFLFADPHFKKSNHRRRVISSNFLAIYAYILRVGGLLYTITDVLDLHNWEVEHLASHPLFERIPNEDLKDDPCFIAMHHATEEGQKVTRLSGQKFPAVYRRIEAKEQ